MAGVWKKWRWRLAKGLGALCLVVLLLVSVGLFYADTTAGKRDLIAWANDYLDTPDGRIELGALEGSIYDEFTLSNIAFSDAEGAWLEVLDAEISWAPLSLLVGDVKLVSLELQTVRFMRPPKSTEAPQPDATPRLALPKLPVDLHIKSFSAEKIEMRAGMVAGGARFRGEGTLDYTRNGDLVLQTDLIALGKNNDRFTVGIGYPQDSDELTIDVNIQAPQGGLIAKIIGLDEQYDAAATFQGAGPLDNWNGVLNVRVGETEIAEGTLQRVGDVLSVRAKLDAGNYVPETGASLLGRTAQLTLDVKPGPQQKLYDVIVELNAETLELSASGSVSSGQMAVPTSVDFELEVVDAEPFNRMFEPAKFQPFILKGSLSGINQSPKMTASFDAASLAYGEQVSASASGQFDATMYSDRIELLSNGNLSGISGDIIEQVKSVVGSDLDWLLNAEIERQSSDFTIKKISLNNQNIAVEATAEIGAEGYPFETAVSLAVNDIGNLLEEVSGTGQLTADIRQAGSEDPLEAAVGFTAGQFTTNSEQANILMGKTPSVTVTINRQPSGVVSLKGLHVEGQLANLDGDASVSADQIITSSSFHLAVKELENVGEIGGLALSGDVDVEGQFSGPLSAPSVELKTGLNQIDLQGLAVQNIGLTALFDDLISKPSGHVTIRGQSSMGALSADANMVSEPDNAISISDIKLALGIYDATGDLVMASDQPVTGSLLVSTRDDETAGPQHFGHVTAELALAGQDGIQRIDITGNLAEGAFPTDGGDVLRIESAALKANILMEENSPTVNANAEFTRVFHPSLQAETAEITLAHSNNKLVYDLHMLGGNIAPFDLSASGLGEFQSDTQKISLKIDGTIGDTLLKSDAPLMFARSEDSKSLKPFSIAIGDGKITGAFSSQNQMLKATLNLTKADIRSVHSLFPQIPFSGIIDARFDVEAKSDNTEGTFDFDLSNIQLDDGVTPLDQDLRLKAAGKLMDKSLSFSGDILLDDTVDARFSGQVPLAIDAENMGVSIPVQAPVAGQLAWQGEVGVIWPVFDLVAHDLSGEFDVDLKLGGTVNDPVLDGGLTAKNGRYEHAQSGFVAADIMLASTIKDRRIQIDSLTATDGDEGALTAEGFAEIMQDFSLDAEARLNLDKVRLIRRPKLGITASSNLIVRNKGTQSYIVGDITVDRANVGQIIEDGATVIELDVREINGENAASTDQLIGQREERRNPAKLDVRLHVPGKLFIRSYGLDSEWESELEIAGSTAQPTVSGTASLVRGTFDFSGKRFKLTQGALTFFEGSSDDPLLNIRAEYQLPDLMAILAIGGRASAPTFEMSSTPALPQDEIVSRIFFGTNVAALSPIEAVQLAATIHSLTKGGGPGFIGGVRRKLGIDRLAIDRAQGRDYGTTITGGKYLTNNIYVEVSTATATGETASSVEVGITKNLSLITRRTLDHDNNLAIRWSWNY